jgi:hypothetical protein
VLAPSWCSIEPGARQRCTSAVGLEAPWAIALPLTFGVAIAVAVLLRRRLRPNDPVAP